MLIEEIHFFNILNFSTYRVLNILIFQHIDFFQKNFSILSYKNHEFVFYRHQVVCYNTVTGK